MKIEIPRDIRDLIPGSHPATLSTQIPAGPDFDGEPDEVTIDGHAEVRWNCATPPVGALRFHFKADGGTAASVIARFNEYFDRCKSLVRAGGPGVPVGHILLNTHAISGVSHNEGVGICAGLPQFEKDCAKRVTVHGPEGRSEGAGRPAKWLLTV